MERDPLELFFYNDAPTPEIYTLSLHDALPICRAYTTPTALHTALEPHAAVADWNGEQLTIRSEEHTSELQSQSNLVCRLLLEKKKSSITPSSSSSTLSGSAPSRLATASPRYIA